MSGPTIDNAQRINQQEADTNTANAETGRQNADSNTANAETGRQNADTNTRHEDRLDRAGIQLEHRLSVIETLLGEVHDVVVGTEGKRSLTDRITDSEAKIEQLEKHLPSWRSRAVQAGVQGAMLLVASYFGLHPPTGGHS
jgi:hypothetical protein